MDARPRLGRVGDRRIACLMSLRFVFKFEFFRCLLMLFRCFASIFYGSFGCLRCVSLMQERSHDKAEQDAVHTTCDACRARSAGAGNSDTVIDTKTTLLMSHIHTMRASMAEMTTMNLGMVGRERQ